MEVLRGEGARGSQGWDSTSSATGARDLGHVTLGLLVCQRDSKCK